MNLPTNSSANPPLAALQAQDDDEIDLLSLLGTLLEAKWLILGVTLLGLLAAGGYAYLSRPVYEANTLIQVEESKPGAAGALGDAAALFEIRSPASAEMEILRSRMVVGGAVDALRLNITAAPRYIPVIGAWLARRAKGLSEPGFMGMAGYVSGTEKIRLSLTNVPDSLEGERLLLTVLSGGGYELAGPDGALLTQGKVGEPVEFAVDGATARIKVDELRGKPGAQFNVVYKSRLSVIQNLQTRLNIAEKGRQSGVMAVSLAGTDPALIASTLATIGSLYVRQNVERKAAEAEKTLGFLGGFLPELKTQLEKSEEQYNRFRNQNSTFDLSNEGKLALETEVSLQTKLLELKQKRQDLASRYTGAVPSMQVIDDQIAAVNRDLAGLTGKVKTLPNLEQELLRLTRDVKVNNELYTNLLNSAQQLRLVKEGKVGNVRVVDPAVTPEEPVQPKKRLVLAVGLLVGLMAGLGLALLRNSLRPGVRDAADIESVAGLPVFATVPHSAAQAALYKTIKARKPGSHVLAISQPDDPSIESLRSLRTALQFAMLDAPNRIVLFSGPTPSLGKSFTSTNFAAVMGMGGKRVLLIDADLRKGHIHQYFGLERGPGLSELVAGSVGLDDAVHRNVSPQVDFISTGALAPNAGELLLSPAMTRLLQQLAPQYDLVLIDTPPVLAVSDAQVLAPMAGTVFLVARAELTTLGELQESVKRLAQTGVQVKGVLFNDLDTSKARHRYGYKYSRYRYTNYQYGSGSASKS
ncbi:MAG: polysaccharide biosynthesis tyrosine autokinase [Ramlibacter sp.]|nr:polysaccharide biosynthesis tyrosine autokinase [Ramlibacter sp.]